MPPLLLARRPPGADAEPAVCVGVVERGFAGGKFVAGGLPGGETGLAAVALGWESS